MLPAGYLILYKDINATIVQQEIRLSSLPISQNELNSAESITITVYDAPIRYKYSGAAATPTEGYSVAANEQFTIEGNANIQNLSIIAETATNANLWISLLTRSIQPVEAEGAFLINDEFTTEQTGPLSSPRLAEPGPGVLTFIQNDGQFAILNSKLDVGLQATDTYGDLSFYGNQLFVEDSALSLTGVFSQDTLGRWVIGWWPDTIIDSSVRFGLFTVGAGVIQPFFNGASITYNLPYSAATDYPYAIIWRSGDYFFYIKDTDGFWQQRWRHIESDDVMYCGLAQLEPSGTVDNWRVIQYSSSLFDPVISIASPIVNTGSVSPGTDPALPDADFRMEFDLDTLQSGGLMQYKLRYQDSDNYWAFEITSAGDVRLLEVVAGSPTQRANAPAAVSGGERISLIARGNTITAWHDNTRSWEYTSATNFLRERDWTIASLGTGGSISSILIWKIYARNESGLGSEIIQNGTFDTDITGWNAWNTPTTHEWSSGRLHVIGDAANDGTAQLINALDTSQYYQISFDYEVISGILQVSKAGMPVFSDLTGSGTESQIFHESDGNNQNLLFTCQGGAAEFYIDNISLKQVQFSPDTLANELDEAMQ